MIGTWKKFIPLVGAAATAILIAGCSSSGGGSSSSGGTSKSASSGATASGSAASGSPINVGLICSCSGAPGFTSYNVPAQQVVQAWVAATNASGGVQGHPIKLITEDDGLNPGKAATAAKDLISQNVVDIIDVSSIEGAFAPIVAAAKIPVTGIYQTSAEFESNPYFYPEGQTNTGVNASLVAIAKQSGAKNLGILYCAESPICAQLVPGMTPIGESLGVPVSYSAQIAATAPNYTAQCLAAKQKGIEALFIGDSAAIQKRVATDCDKQGYDPVFLTQGLGGGEGLFTTPGLKDHMWSEYGNIPFFAESPVITQFNAAMDKYQPGVREDKDLFTQDAFLAWVSMLMFETGLKDGGLTSSTDATPAMLIKGLDSFKGETLGGTAPPLTFEAGKSHKIDCYWTARVQNSEPTVLNSGNYQCPSS